MATHFSILAWEMPWTETPGRLQSTGVSKSLTRLSSNSNVDVLSLYSLRMLIYRFFFLVCISVMDFWLVDTMRVFFFTFIYFIWLCQVYFPDQGLNQGPHVGNVESSSLDHKGSPSCQALYGSTYVQQRRDGSPLQCSCLVSPRDGGAWWAAVSGVTQSQTRLKRPSSSSSSIYVYMTCHLLFS